MISSSIETGRRNGGAWRHRIHISMGPSERVIFDVDADALKKLQKAARKGRGPLWRAFQALDLERHYPKTDAGKDELLAMLKEG
jgi:hypothetical protein